MNSEYSHDTRVRSEVFWERIAHVCCMDCATWVPTLELGVLVLELLHAPVDDGRAYLVAAGETVILLQPPSPCSRCFNRHGEGVSAK